MHPQPLSLRNITFLEMQASTIFAQRGHFFALPMCKNWSMGFVGISKNSPSKKECWVLVATWAGASLVLVIPDSFFSLFLQQWVEEDHVRVRELPEQILTAVVDGFCDQSLAMLAAFNLGYCQLHSVCRATTADHPCVYWADVLFKNTASHDIVRAWLGLDVQGLSVVADLLRARPLLLNSLNVDALTIHVTFVIGMTTMLYDTLCQVERHDVLLFDRLWLDAHGLLFAFVDRHFGFWVRWQEHNIVIESTMSSALSGEHEKKGKQVMANEEHGEELDAPWTDAEQLVDLHQTTSVEKETADHFSLDKVSVTVTFDIGQRDMSIAQLRTLQRGQTFDLGRPLNRAVSIRANSLLIGEGELVDINGRLGVTVHHLEDNRQ